MNARPVNALPISMDTTERGQTRTRSVRLYRSHPDWIEWASRHGLDPNEYPASNQIVCDDVARTIALERYVFLDAPSVDDPRVTVTLRVVDYSQNRYVHEWVTIQLESPALPFPTVGMLPRPELAS